MDITDVNRRKWTMRDIITIAGDSGNRIFMASFLYRNRSCFDPFVILQILIDWVNPTVRTGKVSFI
ncbi:MAG TPA: hypothetical protein VFN95_00860 [Flavitalea sp.]|nr:hypothetical protein [Flavitalea sp.]